MSKLSYQPGLTFFHRLYPLSKLFWLALSTLFVFILQSGAVLISLAFICLILLTLIHPAIWRVRGFRFAFLTGILLLLLYLLFEKSGPVFWDPGIKQLQFTAGGLKLGLQVSGRFLTIVFLSYLFILTTDPNSLAYSLMRAGLPYRFGFMLVTALRLAPILEDEGRTIYQAQLVRGVRYDRGGIRRWYLLSRQFLLPLLVSALTRADRLVFSMEGRNFGRFKTRTFRSEMKLTAQDFAFNIFMFSTAGILFFIDRGGIRL